MADGVRYIREISGETSVKRIGVLEEVFPNKYGVGDFGFMPVFSVFDYGTIHPPVDLDNSTICLMKGWNFEILQKAGEGSHYMGLVGENGRLMKAHDAISRRKTPTIARVRLVNRVQPEFNDGEGWDYSMFRNPSVNNYVLPIEFVSRNELPESSSVWKRVDKGELKLNDLGLPEDFNRGDPVPEHLQPILEYSTKFEPEDRFLSRKNAQELLSLDDERFAGINGRTTRASKIMTAYAAHRGFKREDGKVEFVTYVVVPGIQSDVLGDAVCTWHEDRLTWKGLGISKQRIRDKIKKVNPRWYAETERAKKQARDEGVADFRTLMDPSIKYDSPEPQFFDAVNTLFRAGTSQWVGRKMYDIYMGQGNTLEGDLDRASEEFQRMA